MPWLETGTVVGVVVLAALIWLFVRTRSKDLIEEMLVKRRATARAASRADFMEGPNIIPVALSLGTDRICYENPDLDACLELQHIDEVEYDDETSTGHPVDGRVLRCRAHGHSFEFVMDKAAIAQWESALPARHMDQGRARAV